ncbi:MFS transporter [Micromonospora chersina]
MSQATAPTETPAGSRSTRSFWMFWTAETSSAIGSAVTAVAMPLAAVTLLNATPVEMGLISGAGFIAWIFFALPAGPIVQRLPLRGTLMAMDVLRGLAVLSIPVAWWLGALTVVHLMITALLLGLGNVLASVSSSTLLPTIVSPADLQARNSWLSGANSATQLGGPALGGVLVQWIGAVPTFLFDTVSYGVSALLVRLLPARRADTVDEWPPMWTLIREGWQFVVRHPAIGPLTWMITAINLICGAQLTLFPLYLVRDLHVSSGLLGLLLATEGIGALIGAALATGFSRMVGTARACVLAGAAGAVGALVLPLGSGWPAYLLFAAGNIVFAGGVAIVTVNNQTYRQLASPLDLLPRVTATVRFVSLGVVPIGSLLAGVLAGTVGTRTTLIGFGIASLGIPLILLSSRIGRLRNLPDVATTTP